LWLWKYRKDLAAKIDEEKQKLFDEGAEVEEYAYKLFPGGKTARVANIKDDIDLTKKLFAAGAEVIFQPTISNYDANLFCRSDILKFNKDSGAWDIYEVKSATSVKDINYYDLAFQKICLEQEGEKAGRLYVVYVNSDYVRQGEIEPEKFLVVEEITEEVLKIGEKTRKKILEAQYVLGTKEEPKVRIIKQCCSPYDCGFIEYCWKDIGEGSIYDAYGGLTAKQIETLLDLGITKLLDIPEGFIKKENYLRHIEAVRSGKRKIDHEAIRDELKKIKYPIYFLDYETYSQAVPPFDGYRPYEQMAFQYSLDVLDSPDGKLRHFEYLCREPGDPGVSLARTLSQAIGPEGTVISWFKSFEAGRNKEMGERYPEYREFFESVNKRMFDLMDIFKNGYFVDKGFMASASLKKVMPIVVPELSYKDLAIQEGGTASNSWPKLFDKNLSKAEREKIYRDMLAYCQLDTLAMVEILKVLKSL
jgi:hypothetical protein